MLVKGDKIKLVKQISDNFDRIGSEFEITNILEDGIITFKSYFGVGMMTSKEFEEHFEKVIEEPKREWSEWRSRFDKSGNIFDYKTNNKSVIVGHGRLQTKASCAPDDIFDLEKGIELCLARISLKMSQNKLNELLKKY